MKTDFEKVKEECEKLQKSTLAKRIPDNGKSSHEKVVENWSSTAFWFIMSDFDNLKKYAEKVINNSDEDRPKLRAAINELLLDFVTKNFKLIMTKS
jgi:hypothetical protein